MDERQARRIEELLDREEITAVMHRYTRGIDRVDRALVRSCFHADAKVDYGIFSGIAEEVFDAKARGDEESDTAGWADLTMHFITNIAIELDGDVAHSEAYSLAVHRTTVPSSEMGFTSSDPSAEPAGERRDIISGNRYVDRFERRGDGAWLIANRTEVWEWTRIEPVGNHWLLEEPPFTLGKRDGNDLVQKAT